MAQKRDARTRARERESARGRRQRQQARAAQTGWLISELAALSGHTQRTIRYYLQQGLLSPPVFRGIATRYGRSHLLRLLGVRLLKHDGVRQLSAIKQRLDAAGEAQLLAAVAARSPSAAVAVALGLPLTNAPGGSPPSPEQGAGSKPEVSSGKSTPARGELWLRLQLLPGLELLLAESASPAVRQLALQMQADCASR
jgi:DNA-binding transcriptional MerR regulator